LQLVKEVVNPNAEIVFRENTADDPSRRRPDITKMREKYGWQPRVPLREGLALMVDDFKRRLHVDNN
jgi:UDP-glucuronate decarboxylase